ncbi:hypothetical protein [Pseudomonas mosselii]|uniref:hypothetical protein n=1 Tax=Pseudomonas mosselii TaxID=78327 RepID=UPI000C12C847|nr:hypothetical protein [Pseudomonas mosselii]
MGILAEMALRRARGRLNSVQSRAAAKPSAQDVGDSAATPEAKVVITGPINRYMFLQGRSWAIDMVASLRAVPPAVAVERLAAAAIGKPGSYAAGIQSVVMQLQEIQQ